ncbi:hypothetical protein TNIN_213231 [Trichonephila inaurata madagascariensis]|uniref:Uncharacterized protein n=1 Tax=Trichonephila inaurata madagascariensis TaxID=2747483 RepID=A0A8X7CAE5_9ARAC|nr:hypothetical protein TNIN_213231 [Trichonephila inaurata madagascariensis]
MSESIDGDCWDAVLLLTDSQRNFERRWVAMVTFPFPDAVSRQYRINYHARFKCKLSRCTPSWDDGRCLFIGINIYAAGKRVW